MNDKILELKKMINNNYKSESHAKNCIDYYTVQEILDVINDLMHEVDLLKNKLNMVKK